MDEYETLEAIEAKGAELDAAAEQPEEPWYKKILHRPRRTKMKYRWRVLIALGFLTFGMIVYMASFVTGTPLGAQLNMMSDNIVIKVVGWFFCFLGGILHRDMTSVSTGLSRFLTFGPLSYIIVTTVIAFVIAGIIAFIYSKWATAKTLDDGSPNFQAE